MFYFLMEAVGVKNVFKPDRCGNASPLHIAKVLFPPEKVKRLLKKVRFLEFQELKKKIATRLFSTPKKMEKRPTKCHKNSQGIWKSAKTLRKCPKCLNVQSVFANLHILFPEPKMTEKRPAKYHKSA